MKRLLGSLAAGIAAMLVVTFVAIGLQVPDAAPQSGYLAYLAGGLVAVTAYVASGRVRRDGSAGE